MADMGTVAGVAAGAVTVGGGVAALVHWMRPKLRRLGDFLDDWHGEPPRPGVPARPGVMTRLADLEHNVKRVDSRLADVEHEVHPNSGASMRDAITRIEQQTSPDREA